MVRSCDNLGGLNLKGAIQSCTAILGLHHSTPQDFHSHSYHTALLLPTLFIHNTTGITILSPPALYPTFHQHLYHVQLSAFPLPSATSCSQPNIWLYPQQLSSTHYCPYYWLLWHQWRASPGWSHSALHNISWACIWVWPGPICPLASQGDGLHLHHLSHWPWGWK